MARSTRGDYLICKNRNCRTTYNRRGNSKFCSHECLREEQRLKTRVERVSKICKNKLCKTVFEAAPIRLFCSNECRISHHQYVKKERSDLHRNCMFCWKWHPVWLSDEGKTLSNGRRHCSESCRRMTANLRKYGISAGEYWDIWNSQEGLCQICFLPLDNPRSGPSTSMSTPCIDHNHATGKVRGILHRICNSNLGPIENSPQCVKNCLIYLEKHSEATDARI